MRARRHSSTISIKLRRFKGVLIRLISIFLISAYFLPAPSPALARSGGGPAEGATADSNQNTAPSRLVTRPRQELLPKQSMDKLSPSTRELADRLELTEQLQLLYNPKSGLGKEEKMIIRMKVLETLLEAYFDAASLQGEANREIGRLNSQLEIMSSKRDRAVNLNNAANFILSGTLNTIGSILGFSASMPPLPGNLNQMLSGVVATGTWTKEDASTYPLLSAASRIGSESRALTEEWSQAKKNLLFLLDHGLMRESIDCVQ